MGREDWEMFENIAGSFWSCLCCKLLFKIANTSSVVKTEDQHDVSDDDDNDDGDGVCPHRFISTETAPWSCPVATTASGENTLGWTVP